MVVVVAAAVVSVCMCECVWMQERFMFMRREGPLIVIPRVSVHVCGCVCVSYPVPRKLPQAPLRRSVHGVRHDGLVGACGLM